MISRSLSEILVFAGRNPRPPTNAGRRRPARALVQGMTAPRTLTRGGRPFGRAPARRGELVPTMNPFGSPQALRPQALDPVSDPALESQHSSASQESERPSKAKDTNAAFERWLQFHLRQLYLEVCSEPVPSDLVEVIDRFRRTRQDPEIDEGRPRRRLALPWPWRRGS